MEDSVRPRKRRCSKDHVHMFVDHSCPCPICLESAVSHRSFELPCCNAALAQGEPPQRIHKNCFFAHARASFESKIVVGQSILLMPEEELQRTVRCPRCRHHLAVKRRYVVQNGRLGVDVQWPMDGTAILQAKCPLGASALPERCLLFSVFVGDDVSPPLGNPTKNIVLYDRSPDTLIPEALKPHPTKYTHKHKRRILGYEVD